MLPQTNGISGKYRDLLLAIALFLVIDIGVLAFNYQSSRLIEADTQRINAAGELRMYSQQLTKALLTLRQESADGLPTQTSLAQVSEAYAAHQSALGLLDGALSATRRQFLDDTAATEEGRRQLDALARTWRPLAEATEPLLVDASSSALPTLIDIAATKAVARNIRLMQQADDLSHHLEEMAVKRAQQMRSIQLAAILLALLNFAFIVFKFLRNLAASDRATEEARGETERILGAVREGLFLLDREGGIGSQQSASTEQLLGRKLQAGDDFFAFLASRMPPGEARSAREFISLLFSERVKASLMANLNPLRRIEFKLRSGEVRHLDFEFRQVWQDGQVAYLLVSVSDITEKVVLERELAGAEARMKSEVESLLVLLDQDPVAISTFLDVTRERLLGINAALQQVRASPLAYTQLVNQIGRVVHGIKGESGALCLTPLAQASHRFEDTLSPLRGRHDVSGDDLIPVAVAMSGMLEEVDKIRRLVGRLIHFARPEHREAEISAEAMLQQIEQLTLRVASDLNKKVRFEAAIPDEALPGPLLRALREMLPQLVRNAVAHGIEASDERSQAGKPEEGIVRLTLEINDGGHLVLALEDDGRGLDIARLRHRVVEKGFRSAPEVAAMSDREVAALIFEPGFSSLDEAGPHAGRGDGLSVVRETATRMGASLLVSSRPSEFTRFALLFKDKRWLFAC